MRKVFFLGLIAMLTGCSQENVSPENPNMDLQVNLSLSGGTTRAVDESIIGSDGQGYVLPFTEIKVLKVELYKSLDEGPIFTHTATDPELQEIHATVSGEAAKLSIPKIPVATEYVKIIINPFTDPDPDINHLQVVSQDDPPAPTMSREKIPYEGVSSAIVIPEESTLEYIKTRATVEVAPVLSRFEIKPGGIKITDPVTTGYTFDWTDGEGGKAKIKGFSAGEIGNAEESARVNYRKKYGTDTSASAVYSYRVRLIHLTLPLDFDTNNAATDIYMNYFKQNLTSAIIVKNINDNASDWKRGTGFAEYAKDGKQSNMYDTRTTDGSKVNAFHLFPQSVATTATLQEVKNEMPHVIICFTGTKRWLTIRAFSDKGNSEIIRAFKPGYCYSLDLDDVVITPWSLGLEMRITDGDKVVESDPVIKDYDQTSHVPEPEKSELVMGLKVSKWREKDIEAEL